MTKSKHEIKQAVKKHYGGAVTHKSGCCCGGNNQADSQLDNWMAKASGYSPDDLAAMPDNIVSFGCGNPVALMKVKPGDIVLDLGSGAGLDLILAAKKVGPTGKAIGLDMTPEMIETCRANLKKAGITNAEVRQGEMENMPVDDNEIDWIISNCVINLSPDKEKVFAESFRVLKPGGQMMVSDLVTIGLPEELRDDMAAWVSCIAGAVEEDEYITLAEKAGFVDVKVLGKQIYTASALGGLTDSCGCGNDCSCEDKKHKSNSTDFARYDGRVASIKLYARKP
ncbi:MAG: arsenite methyltransferase [Candidatus Zixiibacteriota bacterium]